MSVGTLTSGRFNFFRALGIAVHVISLLLAVAIFIIAMAERVKHIEYYRIITSPSRGVHQTTMFMALCAFFCALCPITYFVALFLFPLLTFRANRRRLARKAAVEVASKSEVDGTAAVGEAKPPLVAEEIVSDEEMARRRQSTPPGAVNPFAQHDNVEADIPISDAALGGRHAAQAQHASLNELYLPAHRRASTSPSPFQKEIEEYYVGVRWLSLIQTVYFTVTFVMLLLSFFIGLFGSLGTFLAFLTSSQTMEEGWDFFFQNYKTTDDCNIRLCKLQMKGKCSGGTVLCNKTTYSTPTQAYRLQCPYCPDDQVTIATFTQTCAWYYDVGVKYSIMYFILGTVASVCLLVDFTATAFFSRHNVLPCLSLEENRLFTIANAQLSNLDPSQPPKHGSHRSSTGNSQRAVLATGAGDLARPDHEQTGEECTPGKQWRIKKGTHRRPSLKTPQSATTVVIDEN